MMMGMNGFVWWQGVVENRVDPLKLGRCQVRVLGIDSEVKNVDKDRGIPTDLLRWMYPMLPVTEASMNGIGQSPVGLVQGTWVFGFFRDGMNAQDGVMIGTVGGIPQAEPDTSTGFNDPDGVYPKSDYIGEPDTNRLARAEKLSDTIVASKKSAEEQGIKTAAYNLVGVPYNEKPTPYAAEYPYNKVKETESGHVIELDDTPSNERIQIYHRTGSFDEIHPDGSKVTKVVGDGYEITVQDRKCYIKGDLNITVDGDANIYVGGDVTNEVAGNVKQWVHGNVDQHVTGNVTQFVDMNVTQTVGMNVTQTVAMNVTQTIGGFVTQLVTGIVTQTLLSDVFQNVTGNVSQTVLQNVTQQITGNVSQTILQNVTQQVGGNVNQTIGMNLTSTVTGNYVQNVVGNYTLTVNGNISRTGAKITDNGGASTMSLTDAAATLDGPTVQLG